MQVGGGVPGASTRALRPRDRARSPRGGRSTRTDQLVARADAGAVIADIARRHSVELPVPHRRRHDGARLRVREPRRAAGRRGRRRPLLRRRRASRSTHWISETGGSRRSSTPATRPTRCPTFTWRSATASARGCARRSARSALDVAYGQDVAQRARAFLRRAVVLKREVRTGIRRRVALARAALAARWRHVAGLASCWPCDRGRRRVLLGSQAALELRDRARDRRRSQGRLAIEGAEGLAPVARCASRASRGAATRSTSRRDDTALTWCAVDLFSRKSSSPAWARSGSRSRSRTRRRPLALPADLALPLEVDVRNVGVERLEWRIGARSGHVTGVTFDYAGGARAHAIAQAALRHRRRHAGGQRRDRRRRAVSRCPARSRSTATAHFATRAPTSSANGPLRACRGRRERHVARCGARRPRRRSRRSRQPLVVARTSTRATSTSRASRRRCPRRG